MDTTETSRAGKLVWSRDVAAVERVVLDRVQEPAAWCWLLLACIAVDSLKSIAVAASRLSASGRTRPVALTPGVAAPEPTAAGPSLTPF
jgi:hypothetical protein